MKILKNLRDFCFQELVDYRFVKVGIKQINGKK